MSLSINIIKTMLLVANHDITHLRIGNYTINNQGYDIKDNINEDVVEVDGEDDGILLTLFGDCLPLK